MHVVVTKLRQAHEAEGPRRRLATYSGPFFVAVKPCGMRLSAHRADSARRRFGWACHRDASSVHILLLPHVPGVPRREVAEDCDEGASATGAARSELPRVVEHRGVEDEDGPEAGEAADDEEWEPRLDGEE